MYNEPKVPKFWKKKDIELWWKRVKDQPWHPEYAIFHSVFWRNGEKRKKQFTEIVIEREIIINSTTAKNKI